MKYKLHKRRVFIYLSKRKPCKHRKREHNNPPKGVRKMGNHLPGAFLIVKCTLPYIFCSQSQQYQGFSMFLYPQKRLSGTYSFGKLPALWTSLAYISKHSSYIKIKQKINRIRKNNANHHSENAAILKEIAAFFSSTKFDLLVFVLSNCLKKNLIPTDILQQAQTFLFGYKEDRPVLDHPRKSALTGSLEPWPLIKTRLLALCPGCRSPPFLHSILNQIQKIEWRKGNEKL